MNMNNIINKLLKIDAFNKTIESIEQNYKLDIENIFDCINSLTLSGKFYCRYQITDGSKIHSLKYYLLAQGYMCSDNFEYLKDANGEIVYDADGAPIKNKMWLDIWWSN